MCLLPSRVWGGLGFKVVIDLEFKGSGLRFWGVYDYAPNSRTQAPKAHRTRTNRTNRLLLRNIKVI